MSPSGKFRIHPRLLCDQLHPLLRQTLVWFNPEKHQTSEKKSQSETDRCSLSVQDHRPVSPFAKEKKMYMPYHKSLISQMPLYFSLNGGLGTNRPGRGPIQIRPHSLHHQSTPLQHRSFSLHSQCSWSQQLPSSPSASRSLLSLLTLGIQKAPPPRRRHSRLSCVSRCRSTDLGKKESCTQSVWILPCCSYSAADLISAFYLRLLAGYQSYPEQSPHPPSIFKTGLKSSGNRTASYLQVPSIRVYQ